MNNKRDYAEELAVCGGLGEGHHHPDCNADHDWKNGQDLIALADAGQVVRGPDGWSVPASARAFLFTAGFETMYGPRGPVSIVRIPEGGQRAVTRQADYR